MCFSKRQLIYTKMRGIPSTTITIVAVMDVRTSDTQIITQAICQAYWILKWKYTNIILIWYSLKLFSFGASRSVAALLATSRCVHLNGPLINTMSVWCLAHSPLVLSTISDSYALLIFVRDHLFGNVARKEEESGVAYVCSQRKKCTTHFFKALIF